MSSETMSGAEVLATLDEWIEANDTCRPRGHEKVRMDAELEQARAAVAALIAERDELAAEVDELREDAERYRTLAVIDTYDVDWVEFNFTSNGPWYGQPILSINRKPWLDEAVDALRAKARHDG